MKAVRNYSWMLLLVTVMCSMLNSNAQSPISSVYGVNLGDSESTVTALISGNWRTNNNGQRFYSVSKPTLGSCSFQVGNFYFKSGKLTEVIFSSGDAGLMDPSFQGPYGGPSAYDMFLTTSERYRKIYRTMYVDLSGKYGSPVIEDEDQAIWKSNGNMIELKYDFTDTTNQYGWHDCWTRIMVKYSVGSSSSSNF